MIVMPAVKRPCWRGSPRATSVIVACASGAALTGCSVDDRGFVDVRTYESQSARVVELNAWGLSVSTQALDRGLTLGRSRRLYVYPKGSTEESSAGVTLEAFTVREEDRLRLVTDPRTPGGGERATQGREDAPGAIACWTSRTGLALRLSGGGGVAPGFALGLGFEQRGVIDIDPAQDGVLLLLLSPGASDPNALGWARAHFRGSGTNQGGSTCPESSNESTPSDPGRREAAGDAPP